MRIASDTLTGVGNSQITVLRGALGTGVQTHDAGSFAQKVKPLSIEFRRPSILRASGHTFEYLGYGPGNYSTGLPQVQVKSLTEREEFLSQSQERGGGAVVYTGMNNRGDFYIGNKRVTSSTGEETTFDAPTPTVTGQDPARLSVVFDEVTIKERLTVEGGDSKQLLTQFDGPVTFNNEIVSKEKASFKKSVKINDTTDSTTATTGALVVKGGVGIAGTVNLGDKSDIFFPDDVEAVFGDGNDLKIYHKGSNNDNYIDGISGHLYLQDDGDIYISKRDGTTISAKFDTNAAVELSYNGSTKFKTTNTGAIVTGILTATTFSGSGSGITGVPRLDDSDGTTRVQTTTSGLNITGVTTFSSDIDVNGDAYFGDDDKLFFGDSNDLSIFHDGSESIIWDNGTGGIVLQTASSPIELRSLTDGNEVMLKATPNNAVDLHYNGTKTFETISGGAKVTGELQVTDDITAYYSSDKRLKDNITPIENPLAKVLSISGNTFNWNAASKWEGKADTGVVAQEVEALGLPGLTDIREDGTHAVRYEKLVPVLIEAIKELSAKVDNLEQKLSDK